MALDVKTIESLLASKRSSQSKLGKYCFADGRVEQGKPPADLVGSFHGNVGSTRRSTNGRTYRAPNGSRRYLASAAIRENLAWYIIR